MPQPDQMSKWRDPEIIDWLDHCRITGGWTLQSDLSENVFCCRSIGWVVNEDKQKLQVVPHFGKTDDEDMECEGVMTIIKSAIVKRVKLKMPDDAA